MFLTVSNRRTAWRVAAVATVLWTAFYFWEWRWLIEAGAMPPGSLGWLTALGLCLFGMGEKELDPGFYGRLAGRASRRLGRVKTVLRGADVLSTMPAGGATDAEAEAYRAGWLHCAATIEERLTE